jgi:3'-phosphoadenosine 5'-phosphosulfate (PAPS) 3'-phosphatase
VELELGSKAAKRKASAIMRQVVPNSGASDRRLSLAALHLSSISTPSCFSSTAKFSEISADLEQIYPKLIQTAQKFLGASNEMKRVTIL